MSAVLLAVVGLSGFVIGCRIYSKFIPERNLRLDPDFITAAYAFEDGAD